ncbi:MAG: class I SAM-dependent methyltransferase [Chitinophagaceae bacterium]|nr:MAG: class I SAM-dependent methyltransferase [Chitinophagaceae bacterium]
MKTFFHYINFFFYYAVNWNPLLASFLLYHTVRGEKKYGISTFQASELDRYTVEKGDKSKSSRYEAVNYFILENLLENFRKLFPGEINILDAGCGKGRVMIVAAYYGFTKITGVDFAKELCAEAELNIQKVKTKFPGTDFQIVCDDILNYKIKGDENVFFLFNPFNKEIHEKFVDNIEQSVKQFPRTIYFLYASPKHIEVLEERNYKVVYRIKKMKFLKGIIALKHT